MVNAFLGNAIVIGWGCVCALQAAPDETEALRFSQAVERFDEGAWDSLQTVPQAQQGADWHFLAALLRLARGEEKATLELCETLEKRFQSPRGYLLERFVRIHQRGERSLGNRPLDWKTNPSLARAESVLRWTRTYLDRRMFEPSSVESVRHYGPWPSPLSGRKFRDPEPQNPQERLSWLGKGPLLVRLAGTTSRRPLEFRSQGGRWIFLTLMKTREDPAPWIRGCQRLSELTGEVPLVFLWLVKRTDGSTDREEYFSGSLPGIGFPLFVATTRSDIDFLFPGFERGGVSFLLRPDLQIRIVSDRWMPLPILAPMVLREIGE